MFSVDAGSEMAQNKIAEDFKKNIGILGYEDAHS